MTSRPHPMERKYQLLLKTLIERGFIRRSSRVSTWQLLTNPSSPYEDTEAGLRYLKQRNIIKELEK